MPPPLPPLSGNPMTTPSAFDSPPASAAARCVSSLLKTTLLGSPGFGECSLSPNYIVNAELANYNTGSSDDVTTQNNSRWQGDDDDGKMTTTTTHNDLKTTTITSRHDNDFKTTTTTSRRWRQQDKAVLARRSRQQQQQGDFSSDGSDDSDNDNATWFKHPDGEHAVGKENLIAIFDFGETIAEETYNELVDVDNLSLVVEACNEQLLYWHLNNITTNQLLLWTKSDYLWFIYIPPHCNSIIAQLRHGSPVRYVDRVRLSYEEIQVSFCELRLITRDGPPRLVTTEGKELTYSWDTALWETTLTNPKSTLLNPRVYHDTPTDSVRKSSPMNQKKTGTGPDRNRWQPDLRLRFIRPQKFTGCGSSKFGNLDEPPQGRLGPVLTGLYNDNHPLTPASTTTTKYKCTTTVSTPAAPPATSTPTPGWTGLNTAPTPTTNHHRRRHINPSINRNVDTPTTTTCNNNMPMTTSSTTTTLDSRNNDTSTTAAQRLRRHGGSPTDCYGHHDCYDSYDDNYGDDLPVGDDLGDLSDD
ncbi:hypothetical protein EDB85DRAFT_2289686 [Lactarius pseudohatsudake]|nr:hypothetical protein EDB85DRAFT_2289686 [Lactarius pseudohatsudake]